MFLDPDKEVIAILAVNWIAEELRIGWDLHLALNLVDVAFDEAELLCDSLLTAAAEFGLADSVA